MRHLKTISLSLSLLLLVATSACGPAVPATSEPLEPTASVPTATEPPGILDPTPEPTEDPEFALEDLSAASFDNPTEINNPYFPMTPGMEYIYEGFTREGDHQIPHSIIFTVTDLTKEVEGIETVVAYILDYSDGELVEAEIAFYAQDNDGNVWFMGEYPEVYEFGDIVEAPAWIPPFKGARAGIVMKAKPQLGMPSYAQGWGPAVGWSDRGRVVALGEETCVPINCYQEVLITEEFSQSEPDAAQVKHYAPGVGNIKVTWKGEDVSREVLELISLSQLDADAMTDVRDAALELEQSALENSKEVYGASEPLVHSPDVPDPSLVAEFPEFEPANFSTPTRINNAWMPLRIGTRWIHEGTAVDEEGNSFTRRIEFTVTDLTKAIAGVETVAAWIVDYNDGEVVEKEIAFYAQDNDGTVWYLGEYPEEYDNGEFVAASPWIHGIEDARAGIKMLKEPQLGMPSYYQGWGPAVEWSDYGQVDEVGIEVCLPGNCYTNVVVMAESSLGEVNAYQLKYYAPGVGEVRVGWRGEDGSQEELELLQIVRLTRDELAEVREMVIELEQHAFEVSPDVYGQTSPLK